MNGAEKMAAEIEQKITRHVNSLSDPNRATRKRGLEGIQKELFTGSDCNKDALQIVYKTLQPMSIKLLSDPVEKCRELSITLIQKYIDVTHDAESVLPSIVPCLVQRLGQQDITEQSEELRLQLSELITTLVILSKNLNSLYLDDYIKVLQQTLVDPYYEVKKEACKCASILAKAVPQHFHLQSESLIKPLLQSISHQHSKVRVAVVNAIGQVLLYGNNKNVDDVISHLAQRLFDHSPAVREAVTKLAGMWLLELPDRYSYWHKVMPLLLTSLTDELPSIQEEAASLWHDVGIRYLRENENDLKEKEDFEAPQPEHYPPGVERPNLGCRELMYRNQSKLLPGLSRDILDWVVETRKKSSALLYTIIINSEANITQHVAMLMECIYRAAIDEETYVVNYVEKSCEMLGYFVKPEVWLPIVSSAVEKYQHFGSLLAIANLIKGSERSFIAPHILRICEMMSQPYVCTSRQVNMQRKLVDYVNSVLSLYSVGVVEPIPISYDLFKTLISVISVAAEEDVIIKAKESMEQLCAVQDWQMNDLFKEHTRQLLDSFGDTFVHWTNNSEERLMFDTLLVYSGPLVGELLDKIIPMLTANMNPNKDAEVRLKLFTLISRLVQNSAQTLNSANRFGEFSALLIKEMILPNCVWKAGRTAAAIRTTAVSCLWALLKNKTVPVPKI
ncbi:dynein axonemal assembly factor 5-like isoform X2 [Watersipora subatra]|uniref:dynein axonemal assembly factor 5-like isoform X2 n=1 Tax=Watersipora subatra TaxID=2589382 RepID=UPI00355B9C0F